MVVHFLKLIRWQNLSMLIIVQLLFKYVLFKNYQIVINLSNFDFTLLVLAIIFIAAGGNVINDFFDIETDNINKPTKVIVGTVFSQYKAKLLYIILTISGIIFGAYLSCSKQLPYLSIIFIAITGLLFLYSNYLKRIALIGNILVSLLIGFSILLLGVFDVFPNSGNPDNALVLKVMFVYVTFAFGLNFIREIIKDIEDMDGDYTVGLKTLPIIFGKKRAQNCTLFLSSCFAFTLIFTITFYRYLSDFLLGYGFLFVVFPLLYFCYQLYYANTKQDFKKLSSLLKLIMISGMLSIFII
ncbi:MAG: geranylgeranylglycerol-phosphate geranylgeranyltransferase [Flavobacteriaceae bacterium]